MSINYLLHESPVGYAVFEVISQPDTIGSRLKEVQNSIEVFSLTPKFGEFDKLMECRTFQNLEN